MSKRHIILSVGICLAALSAGAARATTEKAYNFVEISEESYKRDTSGFVFEEKRVDENNNIITKYYRILKSDTKEYPDGIASSTVKVESDASENIGLGVKNTNHTDSLNNKQYTNKYNYKYTGDGKNSVYLQGAAVYNEGTIGDTESDLAAINSDFIENSITADSSYPKLVYARGAAIANKGNIGKIESHFVKNTITGNHAEGGAVYNEQNAYIKGIDGDFVGNKATGEDAKGGGIFNLGEIGDVSGTFAGNTVTAATQANGGGIHNNDANAYISSITGTFINNTAIVDGTPFAEISEGQDPGQAWGGAIDNHKAKIGTITGYFSNNQAIATTQDAVANGGAIVNQRADNVDSSIDSITGTFIENKTVGQYMATGGAIYNDSHLNTVSGNFIGNSATADDFAQGGAIYHDGIGSNPALTITNSNFINNSVKGNTAQGGALWGDEFIIVGDGADSLFHGNTANGESNAIYMAGGSATESDHAYLTLTTENNGNIIFDDGIDGTQYSINLTGDGSGKVVFNDIVKNATDFTMGSDTTMQLGKNAEINTGNYYAENNNKLILDVEVDSANNTINNGIIRVENDITGNTDVIVNSLNRDRLKSMEDAYTLFVEAPNDNSDTDSSFNVTRVIGSPYKWGAFKNYLGEEEGSNWYLAVNGEGYMPEVPAYVGMQSAAIEQNRGLSRSLYTGLTANKNRGCCDTKYRKYHEAWINADYTSAKIDSPSEMDADIKGVTAGIDLAANMYHRLGVFGAYRQGEYDLSGKGTLYSDGKSKLDIDSYLGGLYYNYSRYNWTFLAMVYGGKQDIDMNTKDKSVHANTDATEYGISMELARKFYLPRAWIIEPSLGLRYTAVDMDRFNDNVENTVDFDLMHYIEAELGLRFEHLFCINGFTSKVYLKPSVIQTYASGDRVRIDTLAPTDTYKNQLLGRMEIGAKFGLTPSLSAYTSANYTFGSDYKAYGVDAGLAYSW